MGITIVHLLSRQLKCICESADLESKCESNNNQKYPKESEDLGFTEYKLVLGQSKCVLLCILTLHEPKPPYRINMRHA